MGKLYNVKSKKLIAGISFCFRREEGERIKVRKILMYFYGSMERKIVRGKDVASVASENWGLGHPKCDLS